jgi:hypothetical protein
LLWRLEDAMGGGAFEVAHRLGQGEGFRETEQEVDVVGQAFTFDEENVVLRCDPVERLKHAGSNVALKSVGAPFG